MNKDKPTVYSIAKTVSYELLIEELLQRKEELVLQVLEKFTKRKYSITLNIIYLKIFNALLFGILPIFPLIAYMGVFQLLTISVLFEVSIFIKGLIFIIFFSLQFFDFILLGIFNSINVMSGEMFTWLKTLPISDKKLSKIAIFTIFRALDLPIIMITAVFPVIMLIGTQNIMIFIICFGISFMNMFFSFFLLVIFGEKIAKRRNLRKAKSKKSLFLQLVNTFSYTLIIFGSIFIIQLTLSSIITFINIFMNFRYIPLLNLIFSLIPFPFNPSFLTSIFIDPSQINRFLWRNSFIGMCLYIILLYLVYRKAINTFKRTVSRKHKTINLKVDFDKTQVKIKTNSPIRAFLRKDLIIASRSIQEFMSIIAPILFSFVFVFFYNLSYAGGQALFSGTMVFNSILILGFSPFISSLMITNLLDSDISGRTIMSTLPIIPRDQALAKLILLLSIQTISTITPSLMYIFHPNFLDLLISMLVVLPFMYFFLLLIFLLKVKLFSRIRNHYVVEEISSEKKFLKWLKILILIYSIYFLIILFGIVIYYFQGVQTLAMVTALTVIIFFLSLLIFFRSLFPNPKNR